ncbi:hypothetical protein AB5I41_26740 [Sphingomonas sp. MMS24-JH45]
MRSALERAALAADTPAAREAMERAQGESDRLLGTVETALKITRAEAGIGRDAFVPVDLAAALADVAELYDPVARMRATPSWSTPPWRWCCPSIANCWRKRSSTWSTIR